MWCVAPIILGCISPGWRLSKVAVFLDGSCPCVILSWFRKTVCWKKLLHFRNLSAGVALNVRFTTNGMYAKNNTHVCVALTGHHRVIAACDLHYCLLPQGEALRTSRSAFPIAKKWFYDQDVKVVPCAAFTQKTCVRCVSLKKGGDVDAASPLPMRWMCDLPR